MHFVPAYLRPLSQIHTGLESGIDKKAAEVKTITAQSERVRLNQQASVPHWRLKEALQGKRVIESGERVRKEQSVDHPDRHWWIITKELFENLDPALRSHADIFDFLLALNILIDDPVSFSQNPGQVVGGAYRLQKEALDYRDDLSQGQFPNALLSAGEIPKRVTIKGDIIGMFKGVRDARSREITSDEAMDIRVALHMYDDALTATRWTSIANFYYVCENLLCSGKYPDRDDRISSKTSLTEEQARIWREFVNRLKHPDKGDDITGLVEDASDGTIPSLHGMRCAANDALKTAMLPVPE